MYSRILDNQDVFEGVFCDTHSMAIPLDPANRHYQEVLDAIIEQGAACFDGDIPEDLQAAADEKQFNQQLAEYRRAVARLNKYVLADGRPEITEMQPTGEQVYNEETGEMEDVLQEVVVQTAVEPLPATVEIKVYDEENPTYTERTEMQPTGEQVYNEETEQFEDVMEEVTIQELVYTVETVDNPEIIRDTEERAAAQAVVDATPDEVKVF